MRAARNSRLSSRAMCRVRSRPSLERFEEARQRRSRSAHRALRRRRHHRIRHRVGSMRRRPSSLASTSAPTRRRSRLPIAHGVEIRYYNIIYDLVDDVKAGDVRSAGADDARNLPRQRDDTSRCSTSRTLARSQAAVVTEGKVERGAKVRLHARRRRHPRRHAFDLKRFKDEVQRSPAGQECGMSFANYQDIRAGDAIECFNVETITRTL